MAARLATLALLFAAALAQSSDSSSSTGSLVVVTEVQTVIVVPQAVVEVDASGNIVGTTTTYVPVSSTPHPHPFKPSSLSSNQTTTTTSLASKTTSSSATTLPSKAPAVLLAAPASTVPTSTSTSHPVAAANNVKVAPPTSTSMPPPHTTSQAPVAPPPPPPPPPPPSTSSSAIASPAVAPVARSGLGVTYSPYSASGACKSAENVAQDIAAFGGQFSMVRIYSTDCNQVPSVISAIQGTGMVIFAGIYTLSEADSETRALIAAVNGQWDLIDTVSVGNELVNTNQASPAQVISAMNSVRSQLRAAGYNGPVVTVDTMIAMHANPQLCDASDYCAMNCHSFFDGHTLPTAAGSFVQGWVNTIAAQHPGKKVVVSESGWPSGGYANGVAIPSPETQAQAVASLKAAFTQKLFLYSAYNNLWLANNAYTYGAEHYWGVLGNAPSG